MLYLSSLDDCKLRTPEHFSVGSVAEYSLKAKVIFLKSDSETKKNGEKERQKETLNNFLKAVFFL